MADGPGGGRRRSRNPIRRAGVLACAGASLVLAACGSARPPATASRYSHRAAATTTTTATRPASAPGAPAPTAAAGNSGTAGAGNGASPASGPGRSTAAGPTPAQPGTYRYSQSGSFKAGVSSQSVPAQGNVVVDPPTAESPGSWSQVWHSYVDPSQPPSDTTFVIAPTGIAITAEVIRMSGITFSCAFSPPLEVVSWPPAVGHQFAGTGQCGSFTAQVTGQVTGTQPTTVDGAAVTAYVIQTHVTTTGSVSSTSTETDWFDPAAGLDVSQDIAQSGTYDGIAFSSQVSRRILSGRPG